jgi:exonuclease SbcC
MNYQTITISGFGPFGPTPQTLTLQKGITVVLGENEAGKSNLVSEAPLWVLHGTCLSRKGDKIINKTCAAATGEVTFEVQGRTYRAWREIKRKNKGGTEGAVKLFQLTPESGKWRDISANTASATTEKIEEILGVDFDGDISTSVMAQGRSGEFTSKGPADRKAVLSQVLRFVWYQQMSDKAKARAREVQDEILRLSGAIQAAAADIERIPETEARAIELLAEVDPLKIEIARLDEEIASAQQHLDQAVELDRKAEGEEARCAEAEARVAALGTEIERLGREIAELTEKLQSVATARQVVAELAAIPDELDGHAVRQQQHAEITGKAAVSKVRWEADIAAARKELADLQRQADEANADLLKIGELRKEKEKIQDELDAVPEPDIAVLEGRLWQCQDLVAETGKALLSAELEEKRMIDRGVALKKNGGTKCELCGSELTTEHKESELFALRIAIGVCRTEILALNDNNRDAEMAMSVAKNELEKARKEIDRRRKLVSDISAKISVEVILQAAADKAPDPQRIAEVESRIHELEVEPEYLRLRKDADSVGYDAEKHAKAKAAGQRLDAAKAIILSVGDSAGKLDAATARKLELEAEQQQVGMTAREIATAATALRADAENIRGQWAAPLHDATAEKSAAEDKMHQVQRDLAATELVLAALRKTESGLRDQQSGIAEKETEKRRYDTLQKSFGPSGVQAMLIDSAAPNVEAAANDILTRISPGKSVEFRTQKTHINGGTSEVLDIIIIENGSELPYEAFSGGAKFRIDFSIRVGLTKVLAAMTGHGSSMLVIDEGFGSQDENGVDALVSAIYAIADDFEKIVVITHLPELKDRFDNAVMIRRNEELFSEIIA